jgi:hypothetical protein
MMGSAIRRLPLETSARIGVDAHQSDEHDADSDVDKIEHDATSVFRKAEMRRKLVSNPFGIAALSIRKR